MMLDVMFILGSVYDEWAHGMYVSGGIRRPVLVL